MSDWLFLFVGLILFWLGACAIMAGIFYYDSILLCFLGAATCGYSAGMLRSRFQGRGW